jgi:DNA-binding MurR/RpiR family transcriptional regulator
MLAKDSTHRTEVADLFRDSWGEFTRTDRKIARIILANYPAAGLETLAELSQRASVSAPSIIRCVKKLGFDGYPEFQRTLHAELHHKISSSNEGDSQRELALHLPDHVRAKSQRYFDDIAGTFDLLQPDELEDVVRSLSDKSHSITLLGGVNSGALAQLLYRGLIQLRPSCSLLSSDPLERSERLIDIGKRDVLVAFDHPVYDANTASFASLAHERHAKVILFTDTAISPIAAFADSVLCAAGRRDEQFSIASTVVLTEIVIAEVQRSVGQHADARKRELREIAS